MEGTTMPGCARSQIVINGEVEVKEISADAWIG
jgi:hypothetical protein